MSPAETPRLVRMLLSMVPTARLLKSGLFPSNPMAHISLRVLLGPDSILDPREAVRPMV